MNTGALLTNGGMQTQNYVHALNSSSTRAPTNPALGMIHGQYQKRSQSVDRNAPHLKLNPNAIGYSKEKSPANILVSELLPNNQFGVQPNAINGQHFIHDAIERKIERFSRQRHRGTLIIGNPSNTQVIS